MATAIFFNGRRLNVPQAVSKIDASQLAAVSPTAVGIVALVGTAEGGAPLTVDESLADATNPNRVQERYRSGDLRTAGIFAFEPSADDAIPGGAQKEILVKVNPATQGGISLPDDNSADALDITSKDWGLFVNQVNVEVEAGTVQGLKYTVVFEDTTETFDNIGGDPIMDLTYVGGAEGYEIAEASIGAAGLSVAASKSALGLDSERTNDIPAPGVVDVVSDNIADTTQTATVYGLDNGGALVTDTVALNGTTNQQGTVAFTKVLAVRLSAACAGTVTVSDFPVVTTLFTLAPAVLTRGLLDVTNAPVALTTLLVSLTADSAGDEMVVIGRSSTGVTINEVFALATALTTPVAGAVDFAQIDVLLLGDVPAAETLTVSTTAASILNTEYPTVAKAVDRLNNIAGMTANALVANFTTFLLADADYNVAPARPAVDIVDPVVGDFYADLYEAALTLTQQSQYVNAARATGGALPPAATGGPVYLVGGSEGTTTITQWQQAFKLLEKRRYNILVPLSRDPAVHNLALTHLIAKAGRLKSEAQGYVGIGKADGSGETRSEIQAQIQALNTRHLCAISQELDRFDPLTGEATFYPPYIFAAVAAGMQAGSPIAEPLTRKLVIGNDIRNDPSWDVDDDKSDLIDRGLMIAEKVDGVGIRWVRSITTHLADNKLPFVEMSSNESLITFVYEFREALEKRIGKRGLGNTVGSIKSLARGIANRMVEEEKILAHRSLQVDRVGDVYPVSIEVATIDPVNFIPITVHLTSNVSLAA